MNNLQESFERVLDDFYIVKWSKTDGSNVKQILVIHTIRQNDFHCRHSRVSYFFSWTATETKDLYYVATLFGESESKIEAYCISGRLKKLDTSSLSLQKYNEI